MDAFGVTPASQRDILKHDFNFVIPILVNEANFSQLSVCVLGEFTSVLWFPKNFLVWENSKILPRQVH